MAARGRGRGRGLSFSVDTLGFGRGETLPAAIQQPPPLYPVKIKMNTSCCYMYVGFYETHCYSVVVILI